MEMKASQDVMTIEWLRKEHDELSQTMERLRSKCSVAHNNHD